MSEEDLALLHLDERLRPEEETGHTHAARAEAGADLAVTPEADPTAYHALHRPELAVSAEADVPVPVQGPPQDLVLLLPVGVETALTLFRAGAGAEAAQEMNLDHHHPVEEVHHPPILEQKVRLVELENAARVEAKIWMFKAIRGHLPGNACLFGPCCGAMP